MNQSTQVEELAAKLAEHDCDVDELMEALEVAAAFWPEMFTDEWLAACARLGLETDKTTLDLLVDVGAIHRHDDGALSFVDAELPDKLARRSLEQGRWSSLRAACAQAIYEVHPRQTPEIAVRRARHLVEADKHEDALDPLLVAESFHYDSGDFAQAEATLDQYDAILDASDLDDTEPRRGQSLWRRGRLVYAQGAGDEALELLRESEALMEDGDMPAEMGHAALHSGRVLRHLGEHEQARETLDRATRHFAVSGDDRGLALSRASMGVLYLNEGDAKSAIEQFDAAQTTFEALDDSHMIASLSLSMARAWHTSGDRLRATTYVERAREVAQAGEDRIIEAGAWNFEGEMARENQEWGYARRCYTRAASLYQLAGSVAQHVVRFNRALVEIADGKPDEATDILSELEPTYENIGYQSRMPLIYAAMAAANAVKGQVEQVESSVDRLEESLAAAQIAHPDILEQVERVAGSLHNRDDGIVTRLEAIAESQRQALRS